jgi:hypothetical protein
LDNNKYVSYKNEMLKKYKRKQNSSEYHHIKIAIALLVNIPPDSKNYSGAFSIPELTWRSGLQLWT